MQQLSYQPVFELGQLVPTPGAFAALRKAGQQPGELLTRHANREWGDLSDEDRKETRYSLEMRKQYRSWFPLLGTLRWKKSAN